MTSTTTDAPTRFAYQPALDGLRALAVAAVVAFHLDETGITGGFLGVDTFFVLSGFLITTLLILEWRRETKQGRGTIRLGAFWARRARRLLPALILLVIAVAIYAAIEVPPTELGRLRWDGIAGLFYVANWRFVVSGQSYFDLFSAPSPFRHLWSLAIEEQFYLIWPLVTLGCLRLGRGRLRVLGFVTAIGAIGSVALMAALFNPDDPSRAYYGTDTHAHTILIGVLLAILLVDISGSITTSTARRRILDGAGVVAFLVMVASFAFAESASSRLYRGGSAAFALTVAVLIASITLVPRGVVGRILAFKPFVWIGVISYGIYLWHWPVIVYATGSRVGISGAELAAFRVALTLGIAIASYVLVERPIRYGFRGRGAWIAAPAGLAAGVIAIVLGTAGAVAGPSFLSPDPPPATSSTTLGPIGPGTPQHAVLVGDSLAASLGPGLDSALTARGIRFETAATPGCSLLRGVTLQANGHPYPWSRACAEAMTPALRAVVGTEPRPDLVLWFAAWDAVDRELGGRRIRLTDANGRVVLPREVRRAADLLTANGARLMILTVPDPVPGSETVLPGLDETRRVRALNRLYRRAAPTADGRVAVLDLAAIVCPGGRCPARVAGVELRPDGSHFGDDGANYVGTKLTDVILSCWRDPTNCRS